MILVFLLFVPTQAPRSVPLGVLLEHCSASCASLPALHCHKMALLKCAASFLTRLQRETADQSVLEMERRAQEAAEVAAESRKVRVCAF